MGTDRFTRFQDRSLDLILYLLVFGAPAIGAVLVGYAVNMLLLDHLHPRPDQLHIALRTIAWSGGAVLGLGLGFIIAVLLSTLAERAVDAMRKLYGAKPLNEAIRELKEQERSATTDRGRSWFTGLNEKEQRYELYCLLRTHGEGQESLNRLLPFLCAIGLIIVALLALILWWC